MKAVILVGGLGTRLRPLTLHTPKSMVPVLNVPFLEHVLRRLSGCGVHEVVLALSHLAPSVESYLGNGQFLNMDIKYALEPSPLGTAGAARNALGHINDTCIIMNGDIFTDLDVLAMKKHHDLCRSKVTIALTKVSNPCAYGLVETESSSRVRRFLEKPPPHEVTTDAINAGTYIIEPEVLSAIPPDTVVSFERDVFPSLLGRSEPMYAYLDNSYWIDIGTPSKYKQLNADLLASRITSNHLLTTHKNHPGVHPTAKIDGHVLIGDGCTIGENAVIMGPTVIGPHSRVETGAVVSDSVIWHNVAIGADCRIDGSVIGDSCTLSRRCLLSDCVVGAHIVLAEGYCQTGGQIWPGLA